MNGNSSKQVLLSVLGIAILVVAVVGVSFAFFSYTKTGTTSNTIQTGQVYTYLTEGTTITLNNAMPLSSDISQTTTTAAANLGILTFSVTGYNKSGSAIPYKVYLMSGDPVSNKELLPDDSVKFMMSQTGGGTVVKGSTLTDMDTVIGNGSLTTGVEIANGTFAANGTQEVVHSYVINMYIDPSIKISDTDLLVNGTAPSFCAHAHTGNPQTTTAAGNYGCELYMQGGTLKKLAPGGTLPADGEYLPSFTDSYYSVKIKVVANTTAANIAP